MDEPIVGRVYSDEQRAAVVRAYEDPGVSASQVVAMAAAGELRDARGRPLGGFAVPAASVRSMHRKERRRLGPDDLVAANRRLIREILNMAWTEIQAIKRTPAGERDMRRLTAVVALHARIGDVIREDEGSRPAAPASRARGPAPVPEPSGGVGSLMAAHLADQNGEVA